ncbi:MAG: Asp23/Gls24 family envelope stress response protein, partial [Clostridiales bacterium]
KELANDYGKILISKEVIANLAGIAATECFGIVGMVSSRFFSDGIADLLGKESLSKGVEVYITPDNLLIKVNIVVGYGINLSVIANNVIENVRYTVERHTGLKVDHVDVNIQGVKVVD